MAREIRGVSLGVVAVVVKKKEVSFNCLAELDLQLHFQAFSTLSVCVSLSLSRLDCFSFGGLVDCAPERKQPKLPRSKLFN